MMVDSDLDEHESPMLNIQSIQTQAISSPQHTMSRAMEPDAKELMMPRIKQPTSPQSLAQATSSTVTIAAALAKHYLPNSTAFVGGHVRCVPDLAAAMTGVHSHLEHLVSSGVGCGVRCKSRKVDCITVSSGRSFLLMEGMAGVGRMCIYTARSRMEQKAGRACFVIRN